MQNYFKRFEKKYIINKTQYELLMHFAADRLKKEILSGYIIRNLYYDTDRYDLIRASIEKPVYKEKLRLRLYDTPKIGVPAYIELKKKVDGIVYKRRFKSELLEAIAFLGGGNSPTAKIEDRHIIEEIEYFLACNHVKPKALINYKRLCLHEIANPDFRITFDGNLIYKNINSLTEGFHDAPGENLPKLVIGSDQMVMEIKTPSSIPIWLSKIMSELGIYPTSFSKYGMAYKTYVAEDILTGKPTEQISRAGVFQSA